jgi:hypothetical protein
MEENKINVNKKLSKRTNERIKACIEIHNELIKTKTNLIQSLMQDGLTYDDAKEMTEQTIRRVIESERRRIS